MRKLHLLTVWMKFEADTSLASAFNLCSSVDIQPGTKVTAGLHYSSREGLKRSLYIDCNSGST